MWVPTIMWTPISEWCVGRCGSKDEHQKDMCFKEIRLHAQNMSTILGLIVNKIEGTYMTM